MHRRFDRTFYHTVFYCLLIYTHLTICEEDLLLLHPPIARLSTETAAFVSFQLLCHQHFVSVTSASRRFHRQLLRHSLLPVAAFHLLTSASPAVACLHSFTSPSCCCCRLLSYFVVPSSASHSFTSASRCHRWPATR